MVTWLKATQPALAAIPVAKALYRAYFVDDRDISDADVAVDVAGTFGRSGVSTAAPRAPRSTIPP